MGHTVNADKAGRRGQPPPAHREPDRPSGRVGHRTGGRLGVILHRRTVIPRTYHPND
jgi:hypothetical protein